MPLIGVWEKNPEQLSGALSQAFKKHQLAAQIFSLNHAIPCPKELDLFVWQSGAPENPPSLQVRARALIVEGMESAAALKHCMPDMVITAGLDSKDSMTLSSLLLHDGGIAALQRELVRLDGKVIQPQEVYLDGLSGPIVDKLVIRTALLLCSQEELET